MADCPKATLQTVHDALVAGFHGAEMASVGRLLTASSSLTTLEAVSQETLPYLVFRTGTFTTVPWSRWETRVIWDVPAELKVLAEASFAGDGVRGVLEDILFATASIRGLPVDEAGEVMRYGDELRRINQRGELTFLLDKGGPFLTRTVVRPESGDDPFAIADLTFHVEFVAEYDPDVSVRRLMKVASLGLIPINPDGRWILTDPNREKYRLNLPIPALARDTFGVSAHAKPETVVVIGGTKIDLTPVVSVAGADSATILQSLVIQPQPLTLAPTNQWQMTALGYYQDNTARPLTSAATWGTTNALVATVSSTGLVTAVGAGLCNITASFNGVSGLTALTVQT